MAKEGASKLQSVAIGHNKGNLSKGLARISDIDAKIQRLKADRMNVFNDLEDQGFDRKDVAAIVKIQTKPKPLDHKRGVNDMCSELGMPIEYNLTPEQLAKLKEEDAGAGAEDGEEDAA